MAPFRKKDPGQVPSEHLPYEEIHKVVEQLEVGGGLESPPRSVYSKSLKSSVRLLRSERVFSPKWDRVCK